MTIKTETNNTITDSPVSDLYLMSESEFDEPIYNQAKKCLLDYIGVAFAGAKMLRERTLKMLNNFGESSQSVSVIGLNCKTGLLEAALINGLNSHVAELDDGERFGMFHPGAPIFSALLPVAQKFRVSHQEFLKAIIVGYEASIRLARSLQPGLKDKGFHGTSICGTIGATVAIGIALQFSKKQLKDAISAAATSSSGLLKVIKGRSEMKPLNVGIAAKNAVSSAILVMSGFEGPDDVLDGEKGFLNAFTGSYKSHELIINMKSPAIMGIYMKPYAACRHCHPAIEAAIILKSKHCLSSESIKAINIRTYYWAVGGHDHTNIEGISSAKMSTPFSVAVALETDKAGINEFTTDLINNESIQLLTKKNVYADEELTSLAPEKRGAIVQIQTINNLYFEERIDYPKGEPETPLSIDDVKEKFMGLSKYAGIHNVISQMIFNNVTSVRTDINELFKLL